ncbi:DUF6236 family protein [Neisseria dentiae]|nr:DUF6236 family protein [Neisseria dentiae]QMT45043.1 hypothetical protein H3L92_11670 [Neisseria dentiae]STZ50794.1 Uncharacterised protein [Neisseria dentiae]
MQKERGVVISNPFKPNYSFLPKEKYCNIVEELLDYRQRRVASGVRLEGLLSGKDIIKYLVYWDKIDLPNNNIVSTALADDDLILLHEQGILTRTFCQLIGGYSDMASMMLEVQLQAFQFHDKQNPGQWTLAQEIDDLYLPQDKTEMKRVVEFNLFNTLPVPVDSTPIHEILEFKDRRKDELLQLRNHLDDIYISIINAEESGKEYQKRIQEIHQDLYDLNRLFQENKIRTRFDSLKSYFQDILERLSLFGLPSSIAGMANQIPSLAPYVPSINVQMTAGAILAFSRKQIRAPIMDSPLNTSPFAYTFQMGREFRR